ncbi:hypothetical protein K504DRAFT_536262 [Pleomassaria siparia CBS 279.74]|uniref:C2H2-type domain-containing protein n=1 Tax=Pleomassaria siparia CBS 279.74 TaxID=1314801 RepID=A0A6G1K1W1_9PLEO|nr:hypothetical protein K504DRAFT_536262 [Pleomassaria siparia CBS 279.74]
MSHQPHSHKSNPNTSTYNNPSQAHQQPYTQDNRAQSWYTVPRSWDTINPEVSRVLQARVASPTQPSSNQQNYQYQPISRLTTTSLQQVNAIHTPTSGMARHMNESQREASPSPGYGRITLTLFLQNSVFKRFLIKFPTPPRTCQLLAIHIQLAGGDGRHRCLVLAYRCLLLTVLEFVYGQRIPTSHDSRATPWIGVGQHLYTVTCGASLTIHSCHVRSPPCFRRLLTGLNAQYGGTWRLSPPYLCGVTESGEQETRFEGRKKWVAWLLHDTMYLHPMKVQQDKLHLGLDMTSDYKLHWIPWQRCTFYSNLITAGESSYSNTPTIANGTHPLSAQILAGSFVVVPAAFLGGSESQKGPTRLSFSDCQRDSVPVTHLHSTSARKGSLRQRICKTLRQRTCKMFASRSGASNANLVYRNEFIHELGVPPAELEVPHAELPVSQYSTELDGHQECNRVPSRPFPSHAISQPSHVIPSGDYSDCCYPTHPNYSGRSATPNTQSQSPLEMTPLQSCPHSFYQPTPFSFSGSDTSGGPMAKSPLPSSTNMSSTNTAAQAAPQPSSSTFFSPSVSPSSPTLWNHQPYSEQHSIQGGAQQHPSSTSSATLGYTPYVESYGYKSNTADSLHNRENQLISPISTRRGSAAITPADASSTLPTPPAGSPTHSDGTSSLPRTTNSGPFHDEDDQRFRTSQTALFPSSGSSSAMDAAMETIFDNTPNSHRYNIDSVEEEEATSWDEANGYMNNPGIQYQHHHPQTYGSDAYMSLLQESGDSLHESEEPPPIYSPETVGHPSQIDISASRVGPHLGVTQAPMIPGVQNTKKKCSLCGKRFRGFYQKGNLKRHFTQKHSLPEAMRGEFERGLKCRRCPKSFKRADATRKHEWKKHGVPEAEPKKRTERKKGRVLGSLV